MKRLICILLCICLVAFVGCGREKEYEFWRDISEIDKIEIIQVEELHPQKGADYTLFATITDTQAFLQDFKQIKATKRSAIGYHPGEIDCGDIGVKIDYNNGEYEIITCNGKGVFYLSSSQAEFMNYAGNFKFDIEGWNRLLHKYTDNVNYSFVYDRSMIASVDIVDVGDYNSTTYQCDMIQLTSVKDVDIFLDAFSDLPCFVSGFTPTFKGGVRAIKFTYMSGEYELVYCNGSVACLFEQVYIERKDGSHIENGALTQQIEAKDGGYLFDATTFNAFLQQYLNG